MDATLGYKIDAFSVVAHDCTLWDVCAHYELPESLYSYLSSEAPKVGEYVYGVVARFIYNFIVVELPMMEFVQAKKDNLEEFKFSRIRLSSAGKGLNWLRVCDVDVDVVLRRPRPGFKVTRIDFAYDFVNYSDDPDLLQRFKNFVGSTLNLTPSKRLCIQGHQSGIGFTRRDGSSERTVYLGSTGSDRLLRIYDKRLEVMNSNNGLFNDTSFGDPAEVNSWIRIEWQLRNDNAMNYLYSSTPDDAGYKGILREIAKFYNILYYQRKTPAGFWKDYFDPNKLDSLHVHKYHLVYKGRDARNDEYIDRNIDQILLYILRHGEAAFIMKIRQEFKALQCPIDDDEVREQIRQLRERKLRKNLSECSPTGVVKDIPGIKLDSQGSIIYPYCNF